MYNDFASVYDKLQDTDYQKFIRYYEKIFKKFGKKPSLVLDLACGTGNITIPMSERGYDMIGIDLSCEMLNFARMKAQDKKQNILFLNQDMTDFELYGTVDAIVCALDGVNYLTGKGDLSKLFSLAENYLNPGGIMIFDINSEYKLSTVLGDNTFVHEEDDIYYIWKNKYSKRTRVCSFELNFFRRLDDGSYQRFDEFQQEKAYSISEISKAVEKTNLTLEGFYKPFGFTTASDKDERIFFVISKKMG